MRRYFERNELNYIQMALGARRDAIMELVNNTDNQEVIESLFTENKRNLAIAELIFKMTQLADIEAAS